jgi:hypothetical protein
MVGRRAPGNWTCLPQQQHRAVLVSWREKSAHDSKKKRFLADKCIYLISLDDAAYTTATLQETHYDHARFPYGKD